MYRTGRYPTYAVFTNIGWGLTMQSSFFFYKRNNPSDLFNMFALGYNGKRSVGDKLFSKFCHKNFSITFSSFCSNKNNIFRLIQIKIKGQKHFRKRCRGRFEKIWGRPGMICIKIFWLHITRLVRKALCSDIFLRYWEE